MKAKNKIKQKQTKEYFEDNTNNKLWYANETKKHFTEETLNLSKPEQ